MAERKKIKILIIFFLTFTVLLNSGMAEVCFCSKSCSNDFSHDRNENVFHGRCQGTACEGCELEKKQSITATVYNKRSLNGSTFKKRLFYSNFSIQQSTYDGLPGFKYFYEHETFHSYSVFIDNCILII